MSQATPKLREFARWLIAHEARGHKFSGPAAGPAFSVCEELRPKLALLIGKAGYQALLSRALALARARAPSLATAKITDDGSLNWPGIADSKIRPENIAEGASLIVSELLGLLVSFIGEDLTERLVREVWPKIPPNVSISPSGPKVRK